MKEFRPQRTRVSDAWWVLRIELLALTIGMTVALVLVASDALAAGNEPLGARVSIVAAIFVAWLWVGITAIGTFRSRASWVRGSAVTLHILLFAAATGVLQGLLGPDVPSELLGWGGIALALVGFVSAVFARPVINDPEELPGADPETPNNT